MALVLDAVDEDHELVAAEAADLDRVAGEGGKPFGDGIDQAVADRMAERIVDALEVVEVEHGQAAAAVAVAGRHRLGDQLVEIGAVRQAGQVVVARHGADLLLRLDALRHVLEGDDAEFLAALAGRELEMLAVRKRNEDLAVPAFAQRARQLRLDDSCSPWARACRRPRRASASSGCDRPSSASGDLNDIRCAASALATTTRPFGPSMTRPCDMVFSARLKRSAMRFAFFSSLIAVNSTSRTRVGHLA